MIERYRALGAELPLSDLRRAAGRGMDGYFWRFSDSASGRVIVALCGVCRDGAGRTWANTAIAAAPGGFQREADLPVAGAAGDRFAVWAGAGGSALSADADGITVRLGRDARLTVRLTERRDWVRPWLGGVGVAQLIPGLGQYWHPHLLGAEVRGSAVLGDETVSLDGWSAYAEHNWGSGGFPPRWWWGQAQGFERDDVCVAFAGGDVTLGPGRLQATAVVVALGDRTVALGNPVLAPVRLEADGTTWHLHGRGARWGVELEGRGRPEDAHLLPIPLPRERRSVPGAVEHLAARLHLVVRHRGRVAYAGDSTVAGLELGGVSAPRTSGDQ